MTKSHLKSIDTFPKLYSLERKSRKIIKLCIFNFLKKETILYIVFCFEIVQEIYCHVLCKKTEKAGPSVICFLFRPGILLFILNLYIHV